MEPFKDLGVKECNKILKQLPKEGKEDPLLDPFENA